MVDAGLDDVFIDNITFPAADGYLLGATLFLPRGAKRHAVLINSAAAVPRKIYRGFAGYLARRGYAALTYEYRGTGDSRQKSLAGHNQPKSLAGFYKTLPLNYIGHSFGGQALGPLANNAEVSRALLIAACLSDNPWATRPAVELLCSGFTSAKPEILTVTPVDAGATKIGHLGFFRPEHRDTLWRGAAEWMEAAE